MVFIFLKNLTSRLGSVNLTEPTKPMIKIILFPKVFAYEQTMPSKILFFTAFWFSENEFLTRSFSALTSLFNMLHFIITGPCHKNGKVNDLKVSRYFHRSKYHIFSRETMLSTISCFVKLAGFKV